MDSATLSMLAEAEIFRRCFEGSTDGIVITDLDGRIVRVNSAWLTLHGFDEREVLGQTTRLVRSEHTTADVYSQMWAQIRDPAKGFWKGDLVNRRKDGKEIPVLVTITPIRDGERIAGYMGIVLDMRARQELEELKRLYELVVWHDLKAPLAAIRSLLDAVLAGLTGPVSALQKDALERARAQSKRMAALIATALDIEKLRQRKLELEARDVELFALLRETSQTFAERAGHVGVRLTLSAGDRPASVGDRLVARIDPLHAQRCFDNLVKNAIEAAPRESTVSLRLAGEAGFAHLAVSNGGPPMRPEVRATLFHPFGTYGKRGGTGLGLYGVKLLAEAMGGSIRCETGQAGTTFELALPLASESSDNSESKPR